MTTGSPSQNHWLAEDQPGDPYASRPPWDIGHPQPAFAALAESGAWSGRVLDAGCGTGEHALLAASLGLDATGIDLVGSALAQAERKAQERGLPATFRRHNALRLAELGGVFDTVVDCGLFHLFGDADRARYVENLGAALRPQGRYFMLGFSDQQTSDWGPHRLTRDQIEGAFESGWRIDSLERTTIEVTLSPQGAHAWLAALTRLA